MSTRLSRLSVTFFLFVGVGIVMAPSANANFIDVTTTDDELNADGDCSLREAIRAANTNVAVDNCTAGDGTAIDDITLSAETYGIGIAGTDEDAAATGDFDLTDDIEILGQGDDRTVIDGNGADRVLDVLAGATVGLTDLRVTDGLLTEGSVTGGAIRTAGTLSLDRVTVDNGTIIGNGGAIANSGTLSVTSSVISSGSALGNDGGGIYNGGTLTVTDSSLTGNSASVSGGGISNGGTLTVTDSIMSGNVAGSVGAGGAIFNSGTATVSGTTLSGNTGLVRGGAIGNGGTLTISGSTLTGNDTDLSGGAISNGGVLTVVNSTISGNQSDSAGGGIWQTGGTGSLSLLATTITDNTATDGAGIFVDGSTIPSATNTIVADNVTGNDCSAALGTGGGNLDSDDTCFDTGGTDQVNAVPLLGPLADNGGPTETHALQAGSDAIDAGLNGPCPALDQRGFFRPVDGDDDATATCDVGAYEVAPVTLFVTRADDPTPGACSPDDCSLREAVIAANGEPGSNEIALGPRTYTLSIGNAVPIGEDEAATGDLDLTDDVTITGTGAIRTVVDASDIDRVFHILGGTTVEMSGLTITNGTHSRDGGGGIFNDGTLTLTDVVVSSNSALEDGGGGIFNDGTLTVTDSTISSNSTIVDGGGGIRNLGTLTVDDSTISGNTSSMDPFTTEGGSAGGIENLGGTGTVTDSTITGNTADLVGGGLFNHGAFTVTDSTITGNTAAGGGGGLYSVSQGIGEAAVSATLTNVTITDNTAPSGAGILKFGAKPPSATNTIVADNGGQDCNVAVTSGGGNLDSDDTCFDTGGSDQVNADPLLGPLADNGGPTETHALQAGSDAIDAGLNGPCPALDQRGLDRPLDGNDDGTATCDSGAFEANAFSVADVSANEGDTGTAPLTFTVTLATENPGQVTVDYTTSDGTAVAPGDYAADSGTLTFAPGDTSETVTVNVAGDTSDEPNENFTLVLSNPVGAVIADGSATGTITDDDFTPPDVSPSATPTPTPTPTPTDPGPPPIAGCEPAEGDVCGTDGPDALVVGAADDHDSDGAVEVHLGGDDDTLCIQEGLGLTVTVLGGPGDDHVVVGDCSGFASVRADDPPTTLIFRGAGGNDSALAGAGDDDLRGGGGSDELTGNDGNDAIRGGRDDDDLRGGTGRDDVKGGRGDDDLRGNQGRDELAGGRGRDVLNGGGARDRCSDGAGTNFVSCEVKPG